MSERSLAKLGGDWSINGQAWPRLVRGDPLALHLLTMANMLFWAAAIPLLPHSASAPPPPLFFTGFGAWAAFVASFANVAALRYGTVRMKSAAALLIWGWHLSAFAVLTAVAGVAVAILLIGATVAASALVSLRYALLELDA